VQPVVKCLIPDDLIELIEVFILEREGAVDVRDVSSLFYIVLRRSYLKLVNDSGKSTVCAKVWSRLCRSANTARNRPSPTKLKAMTRAKCTGTNWVILRLPVFFFFHRSHCS